MMPNFSQLARRAVEKNRVKAGDNFVLYLGLAWAFIGLSDRSAMGHTDLKSKTPLLQHGFSQLFQELVG
jgi:hypothetical protein